MHEGSLPVHRAGLVAGAQARDPNARRTQNGGFDLKEVKPPP
jgi:hypothetical protein